jgi:hypothetical protein
VYYDQVSGKGAVPYNQEIDYKGLRVLMRPSMFLALAKPMIKGQAEAENFEFLKQWIGNGNPIGSPFLNINFPYVDGKFVTEGARINGHEGRNRALAIKELYGDDPIEVHIITSIGSKRYFTPEMREVVRQGIQGERGLYIPGPIWKQEL